MGELEERAPRADTSNALLNETLETSVNPSISPDTETAIDMASISATDGVNSRERDTIAETSGETVTVIDHVSESDSNIDVVEININTVYTGGTDNCGDIESALEKQINPETFLAVQYKRVVWQRY
jgi:hypothetical protein